VDSSGKTVVTLTVTGAAAAVRLAQHIIDNRARRALIMRRNETTVGLRKLDLKRPEKKICYTREEILACRKSAESWKRPQDLPDLPCVHQES
jgi:hypothetical protein